MSGPTQTDLSGSNLFEPAAKPPPLPATLPVEVQLAAHKIFHDHPHLCACPGNTEPVLRLVMLRQRFAQLEVMINSEGPVIVNRFGEQTIHPAIKIQGTVAGQCATLERQLAISETSRREHIPKNERKKQAQVQQPKPSRPGGLPPLRLA